MLLFLTDLLKNVCGQFFQGESIRICRFWKKKFHGGSNAKKINLDIFALRPINDTLRSILERATYTNFQVNSLEIIHAILKWIKSLGNIWRFLYHNIVTCMGVVVWKLRSESGKMQCDVIFWILYLVMAQFSHIQLYPV